MKAFTQSGRSGDLCCSEEFLCSAFTHCWASVESGALQCCVPLFLLAENWGPGLEQPLLCRADETNQPLLGQKFLPRKLIGQPSDEFLRRL